MMYVLTEGDCKQRYLASACGDEAMTTDDQRQFRGGPAAMARGSLAHLIIVYDR